MTRRRVSTSETTGFSVSTGKVSMRSTAALMSSSTLRLSASSSSSAVTVPRFSWAVERMRLMPSIEAMASSTRMQTPSSASAGEAPRYGTLTVTVSVSISGKTSMTTEINDRAPDTRMKIIRILAATWLAANQASGPLRLSFIPRLQPRDSQSPKRAATMHRRGGLSCRR